MRDIIRALAREKGFTLLEIIVTFIIAALLGSMLIDYLGTSMMRGGEAVTLVQDGFSLNGVVEKIYADYEKAYLKGDYDFDAFKSRIENGNDSTKTPYYGSYDVQTGYIVFSNGTEAPDASGQNRLLKASFRSGTQSLTVLFRK